MSSVQFPSPAPLPGRSLLTVSPRLLSQKPEYSHAGPFSLCAGPRGHYASRVWVSSSCLRECRVLFDKPLICWGTCLIFFRAQLWVLLAGFTGVLLEGSLGLLLRRGLSGGVGKRLGISVRPLRPGWSEPPGC